jgi:hypothetical protein
MAPGVTKPWISSGEEIRTPWVKVPGMLTAKCASTENATYLELTVHADADGKRVDDIAGDVRTAGRVNDGKPVGTGRKAERGLAEGVGPKVKSGPFFLTVGRTASTRHCAFGIVPDTAEPDGSNPQWGIGSG